MVIISIKKSIHIEIYFDKSLNYLIHNGLHNAATKLIKITIL